jgi:hypothetical protein
MREETISSWVKFLALPLFGTLITGLFAWLQNQREIRETNVRIYAELMSQREGADSALRKDMFSSIIGTFLKPASGSVDQQILHLELLANNFHEALDLTPLFKHIHWELASSNSDKRALERLEKLASEVTSKELTVLGEAGAVRALNIDLHELSANPGGLEVFRGDLRLRSDRAGETTRQFIVDALGWDEMRREVLVRLRVSEPDNTGRFEIDNSFVVGFFDFPLVDNTRLSKSDRCAIMLNEVHVHQGFVKATLTYFPGSRASLKDKPYYDEVIEQLLQKSGQAKKEP